MFDFLKKKLKDAKEKISDVVKKKEPVKEEPAEKIVKEVKKPKAPKKKPEKKPKKPAVEHEGIIEEVEEDIKVQESVEEVQELEKAVDVVEKPETPAEPPKKLSITQKLKRAFSSEIELTADDIEPILQDLQMGLLESDVAYDVTDKICSDLKLSLTGSGVRKSDIDDFIEDRLKESITSLFSEAGSMNLLERVDEFKKKNEPFVIVFIGTNGSGKTTSLAKIAKYLKDNGYSSVLAAGDTFRAASIEQLEEHGRRLGVPVIKHKYGSDSAAVIFDAVQHAKARGVNVVLADTAGRSHTNINLMDELNKVIRVNKPHLKVLVVDSLTGNEAVEQALDFNKAVDIDAVILTKTDVNPKGGAALSVSHILKKPILFMGLGQEYDDLKPFNVESFVNNLFS